MLLGVTPATAHVFLDGQDLGASPVSVDVVPGSPVTVELRHPDYASKRLEIDGSQNRVVVELDDKIKRGKAARAKSRATSAKSSGKPGSRASARRKKDDAIGGQLFVEPWAQKP